MAYKSLVDRAMLVNLNLGVWGGKKYDRNVSNETARNFGAGADAGRYNKQLVRKEALAAVNTAASKIRAFHYYHTSPWEHAGPGILAAEMFTTYANGMRELVPGFEAEADKVAHTIYAQECQDAPARLGRMYNASDYPAPDDIRRRFYCEYRISPLPSGADFRVQLGDDIAAEIQADIDQRVDAAVQNVTADCWERLFKVVSHMADRLDAYRVDPETGKGNTRLYDSVVNNVAKLCDVLPRMNVAGDPQLAQAVQEVQHKLAQYSIAELKEDGALRHDVAREAANIAARMASYGQRSAA